MLKYLDAMCYLAQYVIEFNKIQKILYFAQGTHLYQFDKPLFEETMEAYYDGPVVPNIYGEFRKIRNFDVNKIGDKKDFLIEILNKYKLYNLAELKRLTNFKFSPWYFAYKKSDAKINSKSIKIHCEELEKLKANNIDIFKATAMLRKDNSFVETMYVLSDIDISKQIEDGVSK